MLEGSSPQASVNGAARDGAADRFRRARPSCRSAATLPAEAARSTSRSSFPATSSSSPSSSRRSATRSSTSPQHQDAAGHAGRRRGLHRRDRRIGGGGPADQLTVSDCRTTAPAPRWIALALAAAIIAARRVGRDAGRATMPRRGGGAEAAGRRGARSCSTSSCARGRDSAAAASTPPRYAARREELLSALEQHLRRARHDSGPIRRRAGWRRELRPSIRLRPTSRVISAGGARCSSVSLTAAAGDIVGLLGPNGAGKSTLIAMLATLVAPTSGEIRYGDDTRVGSAPALRARIGLLAHELHLYPELTARQNLAFFAELYGLESRTPVDAGARALPGSPIAPTTTCRGFSRGMRQRLALERALLHQPRLVLLDEPFTGLDDRAVGVVADRLRRLAAGGAIVMLATHDLDLADGLVTRVGV